MSTRRIKRLDTAVYHCMSRTVAGEKWLDDRGKEVMRKMLWKVAGFCGVEVLAYCLMSNHFHILVRVPERAELSRGEVLRRYTILYGKEPSPGYPSVEGLKGMFEGEDEELAEEWMERLTTRMHDVSEFLRTLKHRWTVWYNKTHRRFGTPWAERFKSVLVENNPTTLETVAAYLDLNPVRAHLVEDPAAYRWCSYGEAMAGNARARAGLRGTVGSATWEEAVAKYRVVLFGKGSQPKRSGDGAIPWERVQTVLAAGGQVERWELLRCKVRFFSAGAILGSEAFVRAAGADHEAGKAEKQSSTPEADSAPKRKKRLGVIPVALDEMTGVHAWRDLQRAPFDEA